MSLLEGPFGPMLGHELRVAATRARGYFGRVALVAALLAGLATIWGAARGDSAASDALRLKQAGRTFEAMVTILGVALALIAGPAATAGAICVDRSRGTLDWLLTTDLSPREIVLGKLAARVIATLVPLACSLPVLAIAITIGVDPFKLASLGLVIVGVAALGGSLAMLLSIWAAKTHEVLSVIYPLWATWLVPSLGIAVFLDPRTTPGWLQGFAITNPFVVAREGDPGRAALYLAACLAISGVLAAAAVASLVPASRRGPARPSRPRVESAAAARFRRDVPWWPRPDLDANPVLWREWHRARPTRWVRIVWTVYLVATLLAGLPLVLGNLGVEPLRIDVGFTAVASGLLGAIGFLLMGATSATAMAEERSRGSLDILLATPLSTPSIVWGKWRGTFRLTRLVMAWPIALGYSLMIRVTPQAELGYFYVMAAYGLAWSAFVTSLGLAMGVWIGRQDRAVAATLAIVVAISIGFPIVDFIFGLRFASLASPFEAISEMTASMRNGPITVHGDRLAFLVECVSWCSAYLGLAGALLLAVRLTFDRSFGRSPDRPRTPPRDRRAAAPILASPGQLDAI